MTTKFDTELAKNKFMGNVVISITQGSSTYFFTQHDVDQGTFRHEYAGYVSNVALSPTAIDLRDVKTSIPSLSFSLLDDDKVLSALIAADKFAFLALEVNFYFGFRTSSFVWDDYKLFSTSYITSWNKIKNGYSFKAEPATAKLKAPIYNTTTQLDGDHTDSVDTIDLVSATDFPSASGSTYFLKCNDEFVIWTGKTSNQLTGVTRGRLDSEAQSLSDGEDCNLVTKIEDSSMDILLDIMINQVGISSALIDSAAFEGFRDNEFSSDGSFTFYMYAITDTLAWIEKNLLLATNTRLVTKNVDNVFKISIALLDQVDFSNAANSITEDHIVGLPRYSLDVTKIKNTLNIKYDYSEGLDTYQTTKTFTNAESIARVGVKTLALNFKGITSTNSGLATVTDKAERLLKRIAYPKASITVTTLLNRINIDVADRVFLENRFLPQSGTGETFNNMLEVMSKSFSNLTTKGLLKFVVVFTSYAGIRYGLIAPAGSVTTIVSQKIFTMDAAQVALMRVGFRLRLWSKITNDYYADVYRTITAIANNRITVDRNFDTTLTTNVQVRFPVYDEATDAQKAKFAFIAPSSGFFADGTKAYEVL